MPGLGIGAIYFYQYNDLGMIWPAPVGEEGPVLGNHKDLFLHSQHSLLAHPKTMTLLLGDVYGYGPNL